ncbi:hypothetical protein E2C01_061230 [Portunus trituberculatus]|uniref:Uncharacterized protein n=1 Tax=Portunus trituberculatus TaxID=210409 RepID=A0A5B7HAR1_PORTR|nr:hypothetical protein [Portunus trituberculatus]
MKALTPRKESNTKTKAALKDEQVLLAAVQVNEFPVSGKCRVQVRREAAVKDDQTVSQCKGINVRLSNEWVKRTKALGMTGCNEEKGVVSLLIPPCVPALSAKGKAVGGRDVEILVWGRVGVWVVVGIHQGIAVLQGSTK